MTATQKSAFSAIFVSLALSACVMGTPPGFSDGNHWTAPLVAPLENNLLLVPVSIHNQGPFLFVVDPDSPESCLELGLANQLELYTHRSASLRYSADNQIVRFATAEVNTLAVGTLRIRNLQLRLVGDGTLSTTGKKIHGILGRDVIADSLLFHIDRDRGLLHLATPNNLPNPPTTPPISFAQRSRSFAQRPPSFAQRSRSFAQRPPSFSRQSRIERRYVTRMRLNQTHAISMHLDLGGRFSMLRPEQIRARKLRTFRTQIELVDEYGLQRHVTSAALVDSMNIGPSNATAITILPYEDQRLVSRTIDGAIGQNFWSQYKVTVSWHHKKFWLEKRSASIVGDTEKRMARWGNVLGICDEPACVTATLQVIETPNSQAPGTVPPALPAALPADLRKPSRTPTQSKGRAGMNTHRSPQYSLRFDRKLGGLSHAYDVLVMAVDEQQIPLPLPAFVVTFEKGVQSQSWPALDPAYAKAARFAVVDMNLVGHRKCDGAQCVSMLPSQPR